MTNLIVRWLLAMAFLATVSLAQAQQPKQVPRIGYLSNIDPASESARSEAIRLALRELGYIEGQNIEIDYRYADGKNDRHLELATELAHLQVDIIVAAGGSTLVQAVLNASKTIPIVLVGGGADPIEAGLINNLARPGGNVTGLTKLSTELGGKRLELLKETVPKLGRVTVLYNPGRPANALEMKEDVPSAARVLKLTIQPREVRAANDFDSVFAAMDKQGLDGLYVLTGPPMNVNRKRVVDSTLKSRLPSTNARSEYVDEGGLMYYGADQADSYRRVAYFVDRFLKGVKPADLPVEQPKSLSS